MRLTRADNIGAMANRTMSFNGQLLTSITSNGTTGQVTHDGFGNMTHRELEGTTLNYDWTKENFLRKVSKSDGTALEMTYDAWGQRVKKIYTGAGSVVTTLYFGKTYEKRTFSDGTLSQHIIYIYANGQVIAQVTKPGTSATAFNVPNQWRGELAAASLYSGHNLKGAVQKIYHYFRAAALHPQSARWVIMVSFLLFAAGVLASLLASKLQKTARRSSYSPALRWASLSVLMLLTLSSCGGGSPGGGALYAVENYVVSGNTTGRLPEGTFFYHRNHINSTSIVTKLDGTEYSRHLYAPYGELAKDNSSGGNAVTRKFTGQERDEETGLDYFNARYYDPAIGRFVSADTIIPDVLYGQAFNRYAYGLNNPIMHDDPTGHLAPGGPDLVQQSFDVAKAGLGAGIMVVGPGGAALIGFGLILAGTWGNDWDPYLDALTSNPNGIQINPGPVGPTAGQNGSQATAAMAKGLGVSLEALEKALEKAQKEVGGRSLQVIPAK